PVVPARETADLIRQLQLIVKDQDVHGSELRNPCAITGCNPDRYLQGTQLPTRGSGSNSCRRVVVLPTFFGSRTAHTGVKYVIFRKQDEWSASCCVEHMGDGLTTQHVCPKCHSKEIDRVSCGDLLQRLFLKFRCKRSYR